MEITNNYNAPFPFKGLRLDRVKRWGIISMDKAQSVAEHSFNVAVITEIIAYELGMTEPDVNQLVIDAIYHDCDETYTGDIPSPAKNSSERVPTIIKLADCIESYRFAMSHCNDTIKVKQWLTNGLRKEILVLIRKLNISYTIIQPLIEEVQ
jgi:hypothetical protein